MVNLLNVIGVPWPYIDEDTVSELATFIREFARAVQTTHDDATTAIRGIASAYQGSATDAMTSGWAKLSVRHVDEIVDGCQVLATSLDVAAGYIVAQKAEAVALLVGMAAAFVADQAAAVATAGIAEAAVPLIVEGAERLVKSLVLDLEQHVIAEVIEAAAKPLFTKISDALAGAGLVTVRRRGRAGHRRIARSGRGRRSCHRSANARRHHSAARRPVPSARRRADVLMGKEFGEVFRELAEIAGKSLEEAAERVSRLGKEGAEGIEKGVADAKATDAKVKERFEGLRGGTAAEKASAAGERSQPRYENPGHHDPHGGPNPYIPKKAVLPADADAQFANSVQTGENVRWAKVGTGKRAFTIATSSTSRMSGTGAEAPRASPIGAGRRRFR